jgi:uncharacterized protein (TIGR00369 family)
MMDDACFACGKANDNGLKLNISEKDDGVWATIEPPAWSQGYHRLVHGGIIATILDEMAVWAAFKKGYRSVTAQLNMRIKEPMHLEQTYTARAQVRHVKHRLVEAESQITDAQDLMIARAQVKLILIEP